MTNELSFAREAAAGEAVAIDERVIFSKQTLDKFLHDQQTIKRSKKKEISCL